MTYQLVLATDLDGTFLEGDRQSKLFFYNKLLELRDQVLLVYTTGRPVDVVKSFCARGYLPTPHFVLGDHGTHIVDGVDFEPIECLQVPIAQKWKDGSTCLKELLREERGITLQPLNPPYRVAYYYDSRFLQLQILEKIVRAGFDYIQSCDMYLDILPQGVNKGSSLLNLIAHLKIDPAHVVTAGDSLNDLPLFETGLKGIAVSNSEPKLLKAVADFSHVYCSTSPGVCGIMDGLKFFKMFHLFEDALHAETHKER